MLRAARDTPHSFCEAVSRVTIKYTSQDDAGAPKLLGRFFFHSVCLIVTSRPPGVSISISIQGALEEVAEALTPSEHMYTFLDDVYIVCQPERVRVLFDMLAGALTRVAGIRPHDGKTRV